ncbi:MAG: hypothetical protein GWN16_00355, partial [Calditrichae bacterium]|nr:hypothetical protein [candidate division Zixibacteria bacterium]NIW77986.1 hypothetical protein [Calditrichia bacterium]
EKAEQVFLEVLSLNPRDEETLNFIGMTCIKLERLEEAEKYLRRYIKYRPTALPPRNNLGMLLMNIGDYEGAKNEFLKIIRMDETHWMAWDNLLFLDSYHVLAGPDEI